MVEYSFMGAMVALFAFISVGGLSSSLETYSSDMADRMNSNQQANQPATTGIPNGTNTSGTSATGSTSTSTSTSSSHQVEITLSNGQSLSFELPKSLKAEIDATGANGVTMKLANQMKALAKALARSGEIDKNQQSLLMALANQGHFMGKIQGHLATIADSAHTVGEFQGSYVTIDGKYYTTADLINAVGYGGVNIVVGPEDVGPDPFSAPLAFPETQAFIDLYHQAEASGAMNDPGVKALIEEFACEILFLGEVVQHGAVQSIVQNDMGLMSDSALASETVHFDSSGICQAGNHQSQNYTCL